MLNKTIYENFRQFFSPPSGRTASKYNEKIQKRIIVETKNQLNIVAHTSANTRHNYKML